MSPTPPVVPSTADELTSEVLSAALGGDVTVTSVERVGAAFGFAGQSYRVSLSSSGVPGVVLAKLWRFDDETGLRELRFYERLAAATPARLPSFHHGGAEPAGGHAWIVIGYLDGARQGDELVDETLDSTIRLAQTAARVHAAWWDREVELAWLPAARPPREHDWFAARRVEFLERFGPIEQPAARRLFDELPDRIVAADAMLADAPSTLVHDDLGLDNVLFDASTDEPTLLDWANCVTGPGTHDLAAILVGVPTLDQLSRVVDAYAAELTRSAPALVNRSDVDRWIDAAMTHQYARRTLGIARWRPTDERGRRIIDRYLDRTPHVIAAWHDARRSDGRR
ncbi:MAG: aminoglycoside phosphotransferase family protein [Actinomycetota bacterium]